MDWYQIMPFGRCIHLYQQSLRFENTYNLCYTQVTSNLTFNLEKSTIINNLIIFALEVLVFVIFSDSLLSKFVCKHSAQSLNNNNLAISYLIIFHRQFLETQCLKILQKIDKICSYFTQTHHCSHRHSVIATWIDQCGGNYILDLLKK